jgi:hypothetical protein
MMMTQPSVSRLPLPPANSEGSTRHISEESREELNLSAHQRLSSPSPNYLPPTKSATHASPTFAQFRFLLRARTR